MRLVELYTPLVSHWTRSSGIRAADVADVLQEVFRSAMGGISAFRRDRQGDSFRAWLRTITRSKVNDHFRKRANDPLYGQDSALERRPAPELESRGVDEESSAFDEVEARLQAHLLERALEEVRGRVKSHTYQAFVRCVLEDRAPSHVAEELGMTPGAVRVAKTRVLQRLRAALGDIE